MKKKFLQQKRQEACRWLSANKGDEYWFEARAYIKINGTEVFTCRADLSGKEVIEEYYINFGATLESVPGETKIEGTYTDIYGNQQKGIFNISVTDVFFRNMSLN